jgi:hypothetical protein
MSLSIVVLAAGCIAFSLSSVNLPLLWARNIATGFFF